MGKPNFGLIGAIITASIAIPTTLLMSNSNNDDFPKEEIVNEKEEQKENREFTKLVWGGSKIPVLEKSSDIKKKYKEVECLKKSYIGWNEGNRQIPIGNPNESAIHSSYISKGCLTIEYYKQATGTNKKWRGGFRLIWSLSGEKRGLITVFNINTNEEKLSLDSSIYILDKTFYSSWTLLYAQENIIRTIYNNNQLSRYFPKSGNPMGINYWGFDPENKEIKNSGTLTSIVWNWTKNDTKSTPVTDWSSNYTAWFKELFSSWFQIQNQLKELKGTWTKEA